MMAAGVFARPGRLPGAAVQSRRAVADDEDSSSEEEEEEDSEGQGQREAACRLRRRRRGGSRGVGFGPPGRAPASSSSSSPQIIHSGHFMVSSPHSEHPPKKGYDFDTVNEQTCHTYRFGPAAAAQGAAGGGDGRGGDGAGGGGREGGKSGGGRGERDGDGGGGGGGRLSIDASLTKLFECMTLAYSGKLVSPKWKNFKGLKLQCRDKIRLNNAIWRAWYIQYLEKRKNPVCHFVTPLDGSIEAEEHRHPEAIATEGKYWKRRIEIVIREYHKWRTYFKKRLQKHKDEDLSILVRDDDPFFWAKETYGRETPVPMELDSLFNTDMLMSELPDTLFSTLSSHQPVPNARATARLGNADMIQPGLSPLQPNCMDSSEFFQELFSPFRSSNGFPSAISVMADACGPSSQTSDMSSGFLVNPLSSALNLGEGLLSPSVPDPHIMPPVVDIGADTCLGLRTGDPFLQSAIFNPQPSLSSPQPFLPHFPTLVPLVQPGTPPLPLTPQTLPFVSSEALRFGACKSSVITHTASATPTHSVPATTFSQGQGSLLAAQQLGGGMSYNLAVQTAVIQGQQLLQPHTTFSVPLASAGARPKKPQKIVPAPKPETVPLVLKNAFFAPAAFQGQSRAVIVTPAPLKRDGLLTPRMSQPNVAIAPSGMAGAPRAAELHSSILLSQQVPSPQPVATALPHLFSPGTIQEALMKVEQAPPHTTCSQVCSPASSCLPTGQVSPCPSEQSASPQSPQNNSGKIATDPQMAAFKNRRMKHISAEQKRRFNIKIGFSTLNSLVSSYSKSISHALTLQKTVEYIAKLQQERTQLQEEAKRLREEIEDLNATIISCQQQLPATGVPITRQRFDQMRSMFEEYVRNRTGQNWKFWIFSIIINPLFETFNGMVSTTSFVELNQTALAWVDQHCSLPVLRPMVLNTLRHLSTTTSILSDPLRLREQAIEAISKLSKPTGDN